MKRNNDKKRNSVTSLSPEEREQLWDDSYEKEEGIILELDHDKKAGKLQSLKDKSTYKIDVRELVRTKLELRPGDKVLFAPFEDPEHDDFARIIRILDLNV